MESKQIQSDGFISLDELSKIEAFETKRNFSLHWELRTILYLGILLLTSGIGILVYKNIDTIGHQVILAVIALLCGGCFYYTFKQRKLYSNLEVKYESPFFDYILLLGCLLFGVFMGYMQIQYQVVGMRWSIITLLPTILYIYCGYVFDHKGVLSLGLTGLASTIGLTVTPIDLLSKNNFSSLTLIWTALFLGTCLLLWAVYSEMKNIKAHFSFTYNNFAANLLFVASLAALFNFEYKALSFILLAGVCFYYIRYALARQSFLFLLISVIYGYIGLTYVFFSFLEHQSDGGEFAFSLGFLYIVASCAGVIVFFLNHKKIMNRKNDSI